MHAKRINHAGQWQCRGCGAIDTLPYSYIYSGAENLLYLWFCVRGLIGIILYTMSAELASMMRCHFLLLSILVQVQCQETYPYVSFRNWTLANHSYVNFSTVGSDYYSVQCHTDLSTCCSDTEGIHRGDWYFPNGTRLPNFTSSTAIGESREAQKVVVNHNGGIKPSGIYCCDIAIDDGSTRDIIYVGMYFSNGGKVQCHNSRHKKCSKFHCKINLNTIEIINILHNHYL